MVHHRRHAGAQPYHCVRCQKKFFRKCDLLAHLRCHLGNHLNFLVCVVYNVFLRSRQQKKLVVFNNSNYTFLPLNFEAPGLCSLYCLFLLFQSSRETVNSNFKFLCRLHAIAYYFSSNHSIIIFYYPKGHSMPFHQADNQPSQIFFIFGS